MENSADLKLGAAEEMDNFAQLELGAAEEMDNLADLEAVAQERDFARLEAEKKMRMTLELLSQRSFTHYARNLLHFLPYQRNTCKRSSPNFT